MAALHLRPHHLLCIQNYRGHGYSEGFNQKMLAVIEVLQQAGGAQVRIIEGADDLCSSCPNCSGGECTSGNPALFDSLVLQRTCLVPGDEISLQLRGGCRGCVLSIRIPQNRKGNSPFTDWEFLIFGKRHTADWPAA